MTIPPTHDDGRGRPEQIPQNWPPYVPQRVPKLVSRNLSFAVGVLYGGVTALVVWLLIPVVAALVLVWFR